MPAAASYSEHSLLKFSPGIDSTMSPSSYATVGDSFRAIGILSTIIFTVSVVSFYDSFDSEWARQGFCIVNEDIPFQSSHDWCAYLDAVLALTLGVMYLTLRSSPGMNSANDLVKYNIAGIAGHGLGHWTLGKAMREGTMQFGASFYETSKDQSLTKNISDNIPILIFWLCLLKASCAELSLHSISVLAVTAQLVGMVVPTQFAFTYVNAVLFLAFSINQISRDSKVKDFEYALFPAIVAIPLGLVAWLESTMCSSSLVQALYGHVMYDVYIPLSLMVFYLVAYTRQCKLHVTKKEI